MNDLDWVCCEAMVAQLRWSCDKHDSPADCPDCLVWYYPEQAVFGLPVHDGGSSFMQIEYCPWCGTNLTSLTPHSRPIVPIFRPPHDRKPQ